MTDTTANSTKQNRRWLSFLLGALILAAIGIGIGKFFRAPFSVEMSERTALRLDLTQPDVLLETHSLSQLPKALLEVPILRDTLTEDFVFYYEHHVDRFGLIGSLRRIIYEHDLQLQDNLIELLLDQPADVALWKDGKGRLSHFALVMQRGGLARLLEPLAHVALDDKQLSLVGALEVSGEQVPLYQLTYNNRKSLLFASYKDRLLVLSDQGMLFDTQEQAQGRLATETASQLLAGEQVFPQRFGLHTRGELNDRISMNASFLALGYQRFIPAFAGVRFDHTEDGWKSFVALDQLENAEPFDFSEVWQAMPMGAAACVAVPVLNKQYLSLLGRLTVTEENARQLVNSLDETAGLCWYADSRLYTPLLVGSLYQDADLQAVDGILGELFEYTIGSKESKLNDGTFPVDEQETERSHSWQRIVSSHAGIHPADQAGNPEEITGRAFFRVSLARQGNHLMFSLDDRLVSKAQQTLDKQFPPMQDVIATDALVPAYAAPESLARLFRQETFDSLPQDMEPIFRNAAETHLLPKLQALAEHKAYIVALPKDSKPDASWKWLPLEWRPL